MARRAALLVVLTMDSVPLAVVTVQVAGRVAVPASLSSVQRLEQPVEMQVYALVASMLGQAFDLRPSAWVREVLAEDLIELPPSAAWLTAVSAAWVMSAA